MGSPEEGSAEKRGCCGGCCLTWPVIFVAVLAGSPYVLGKMESVGLNIPFVGPDLEGYANCVDSTFIWVFGHLQPWFENVRDVVSTLFSDVVKLTEENNGTGPEQWERRSE